MDWDFWRKARAQEQQQNGPFTRLDQLPKGAVVHRPEPVRQIQQQQQSANPEQAARDAMGQE